MKTYLNLFIFLSCMLLGLNQTSFAGTREEDVHIESNSDTDPSNNSCSTDWCAKYNALDELECIAVAALESLPTPAHYCYDYIFQPSGCKTDPNTGCQVQNGQSACIIQCVDWEWSGYNSKFTLGFYPIW